jgi:hypothetical protein
MSTCKSLVEPHATALWYGLGCGDELSSHALPGLWVNSEIPATGVGGMVQILSRSNAIDPNPSHGKWVDGSDLF